VRPGGHRLRRRRRLRRVAARLRCRVRRRVAGRSRHRAQRRRRHRRAAGRRHVQGLLRPVAQSRAGALEVAAPAMAPETRAVPVVRAAVPGLEAPLRLVPARRARAQVPSGRRRAGGRCRAAAAASPAAFGGRRAGGRDDRIGRGDCPGRQLPASTAVFAVAYPDAAVHTAAVVYAASAAAASVAFFLATGGPRCPAAAALHGGLRGVGAPARRVPTGRRAGGGRLGSARGVVRADAGECAACVCGGMGRAGRRRASLGAPRDRACPRLALAPPPSLSVFPRPR